MQSMDSLIQNQQNRHDSLSHGITKGLSPVVSPSLVTVLMETLHGLRGDWDFSDEEYQLLLDYYGASRLLSICAVRAGKSLSARYRQQLANSLLALPNNRSDG